MLNVLYISSWHQVLETDLLTILPSLGHSVFSTGIFSDPHKPMDTLRDPLLDLPRHEGWIEEFSKLNPAKTLHGHINLTKEFVDKFDLVIAEHCNPLPREFGDLWPFIGHKPCIFRTYCQQHPETEHILRQIKSQKPVTLVRVATTEKNMPGFAGMDFVIKGYIDHDKFKEWNGFGNEVLTFNNMFRARTWHSNTDVYLRLKQNLAPYEFHLYGQNNQDVEICRGILSAEDQIKAYQRCGVYFSLGSKPAALTYNFQEALATGCPIVTFGRTLGNSNMKLYEVPDLVENGKEAFYSDHTAELEYYIRLLLKDENLARKMSAAAREKSIKLWSKEAITGQWKQAIEFTLNRN